jgi:hypothetical protein
MKDGMMSGGMMWAMGLVWLLVVIVLLLIKGREPEAPFRNTLDA